ncbi:flippase-like domain-containing protein [Desulfovibrio aminophilus]|nr:lysylphosphatidylglycerol synthase domain-containing protein [Desulfovibrio aminophilus]MCM0756028.1 flippase-like domain-containing protein [Desulfovibrio aminophilus]
MRAEHRRVLFFLLKAAVVGAFLFWLARRGALDPRYFAIASGGLGWLLLGLACLAASISLTAVRYWLILRMFRVRQPLPFVLRTEFAATFFNLCSLGPLGGDVVRLYFMARSSGKGLAAAGATMTDRIVGLLALLLLTLASLALTGVDYLAEPVLREAVVLLSGLLAGAVGLALTAAVRLRLGRVAAICAGGAAAAAAVTYSLWAETAFGWSVAAGLAAATVCAGGFQAAFVGALLRRIGRWGGFGEKLDETLAAMSDAAGHPRAIAGVLGLALVQQAGYVLAMLCLAWAMNLPARPDAGSIFFATPLTFILAVLPLPGAGLGFNEAAFDSLLALAAPHLAGGASLYLFFRAWLIAVSFAGIPFYLFERRKSRSGGPTS